MCVEGPYCEWRLASLDWIIFLAKTKGLMRRHKLQPWGWTSLIFNEQGKWVWLAGGGADRREKEWKHVSTGVLGLLVFWDRLLLQLYPSSNPDPGLCSISQCFGWGSRREREGENRGNAEMSMSQSQRDCQNAGTRTAHVTNLPCAHLLVSPDYKPGIFVDLEHFLGELQKWQSLGLDADQRRAPAHGDLALPLWADTRDKKRTVQINDRSRWSPFTCLESTPIFLCTCGGGCPTLNLFPLLCQRAGLCPSPVQVLSTKEAWQKRAEPTPPPASGIAAFDSCQRTYLTLAQTPYVPECCMCQPVWPGSLMPAAPLHSLLIPGNPHAPWGSIFESCA